MISPATSRLRAAELLPGFAPEIPAAYIAFAESGDPRNLDIVVLGVLRFYLAHAPAQPWGEMAGSTRLIEDLGCDSLTMMDTVFLVEGLFDIKLDDAKLAKMVTLDDLREHLRGHFKGSAVSPGAAS